MSPKSGLALRESPSTDLNWTAGQTNISPATGVPVDCKENDYGTQQNAWTSKTVRHLAYR